MTDKIGKIIIYEEEMLEFIKDIEKTQYSTIKIIRMEDVRIIQIK